MYYLGFSIIMANISYTVIVFLLQHTVLDIVTGSYRGADIYLKRYGTNLSDKTGTTEIEERNLFDIKSPALTNLFLTQTMYTQTVIVERFKIHLHTYLSRINLQLHNIIWLYRLSFSSLTSFQSLCLPISCYHLLSHFS